jgi:hypothetical protein
MSGYESPIYNAFKNGDRNQPADFGTGAIYNRQAARRVISNDGEFFYKTIYAQGRHLAVWVNGTQVSDYVDINPPGADVFKNQARVTPGAISLQAHDPATNLDFRNLKIVDLSQP